MGNPHPTKSKPVKIGRKHTNAKSEKAKQRQRNAAIRSQKLALIKRRKWNQAVSDYFEGYITHFPWTTEND